ncbi:hypothetical protein HZH66_000034 [Vespula vulgaris]|uniref:Uncharacterized protein n=1 Tax=Vespula vulgaris TaxID=7454 RepID=A0A834NKT6_VESVU|nr:hypothetical protein HZH66_000034 [Vespula vulgaris]
MSENKIHEEERREEDIENTSNSNRDKKEEEEVSRWNEKLRARNTNDFRRERPKQEGSSATCFDEEKGVTKRFPESMKLNRGHDRTSSEEILRLAK